jgi:alkanesulfonate monooxygenase SsuD/methylene tetrahydromethanopterin reductase-like flavin-dependent oxidoreductase (luciferase family)
MFMAAVAQHTRRIRLGTAVTLLPFHNPVRVVEDVAMLDILSGGRIDVGVGRGMDAQYYPIFGVEIATSQEKFDEELAMVKAAFRNEPFTWEGTFFQCPDPINVLPRPVQQPHPPLWVPNSKNPAHSRAIGRAGVNPGRPAADPLRASPRSIRRGHRSAQLDGLDRGSWPDAG